MAREIERRRPRTVMVILLRRALSSLWRSARIILGCAFILLGILGVILPVLPGMPFLLIGTFLIGRRSRLLRGASIWGKRQLRHWAADERPLVGATGRWALRTQRDTSRQLRHVGWWCQARRRARGRRLRGA